MAEDNQGLSCQSGIMVIDEVRPRDIKPLLDEIVLAIHGGSHPVSIVLEVTIRTYGTPKLLFEIG